MATHSFSCHCKHCCKILGPRATAASSSVLHLMPDRFQSSEESSPPAPADGKKGKSKKEKQKKTGKKSKDKKTKKNKKDKNDDDEEESEHDHVPLGGDDSDEDADDDDDMGGLDGYDDLLNVEGEGSKGGAKKRPASSKAAPRKRPAKKHDDLTEAWGLVATREQESNLEDSLIFFSILLSLAGQGKPFEHLIENPIEQVMEPLPERPAHLESKQTLLENCLV